MQALLMDARKQVGALSIKVEPVGAEVLVDGVSVGKAPLEGEVFVEPGSHRIEAKLEGYEAAKQGVSAAAGSAQDVEIRLSPIEKKESGERTKLGGSAEDRGGDAAGQQARSAQREAPKTLPPEGERAEGGPNKGVVIAGIAASVTAVGLGVGFAVASNANASDADAQRTAFILRDEPYPCLTDAPPKECAEHSDTIGSQGTFANASVFSFVMGGVLGTATAIYGLVLPSSKRTNPVRAVPVAMERGGGLVIAGSW